MAISGWGRLTIATGKWQSLEGRVYQARADGMVREVADSVTAPFSVRSYYKI